MSLFYINLHLGSKLCHQKILICKLWLWKLFYVTGIKEKIADFKSKHSLTDREFPVAKLFVVISSSMYTSNDLSDMSHSWMEPAGVKRLVQQLIVFHTVHIQYFLQISYQRECSEGRDIASSVNHSLCSKPSHIQVHDIFEWNVLSTELTNTHAWLGWGWWIFGML